MNPLLVIGWIRGLLRTPQEPSEFIINIYSNTNYWVIISRILDVESAFKRRFRRIGEEILIEEYAKQGVQITIRNSGARSLNMYYDPQPNLRNRRIAGPIATQRLNEFTVTRLAELTGRNPQELEKMNKVLVAGLRAGKLNHIQTFKVSVQMALLSSYFPVREFIWNGPLLKLCYVGSECHNCTIDFSIDHQRWLRISKTFRKRVDLYLHFLMCQSNRVEKIRELTHNNQFVSKTTLPKTQPITANSSLTLSVAYPLEKIEELAHLIETKQLSRKFLSQCWAEGILCDPFDFVQLKSIVGQIGWMTTAAYYHRRVPVGHLLSVHALVSSGLLPFYEARQAVEAGVLPEIQDIIDSLKPSVDDLIKISQLVQRHGPDPIKSSLAKAGISRSLIFWATHPQASDMNWEEMWVAWETEQAIPRKTSPYSNLGTVGPSRRKTRTVAILPTENQPVPQSGDHGINPVWYKSVTASQLPKTSGKEWQRLLESCGWRITHKTGGSHKKMHKGSWEFVFVDYGSGHANRYVIFDCMRRGKVPEEEVLRIITTWQEK